MCDGVSQRLHAPYHPFPPSRGRRGCALWAAEVGESLMLFARAVGWYWRCCCALSFNSCGRHLSEAPPVPFHDLGMPESPDLFHVLDGYEMQFSQ